MKKSVPFLPLFILLVVTSYSAYSQVTLVSDNTNLSSGFVLPNGIPLLQSDSGQIYTTNGTSATLLTSAVSVSDTGSAIIYKNQLFFAGIDASKDVELWVTDGTSGGTHLVKNISANGSSVPTNFFVLDNKLYFTADDGVNGRELWSSDGTSGGTSLLINIDNASTSSFDNNSSFFSNGSTVYFTATNNKVVGIYKIVSNTVSLLKNNIGDEIDVDAGIYAAAIGNKVVFTVKKGGYLAGTSQLWSTDGTTNNTVLLKDFGAGSYSSFFPAPVLFKGLLYFAFDNFLGSTSSLYTTDGTAANTTLFKSFSNDQNSPDLSLSLFNSVIINNKLYFTAYDTEHGSEIWSTDGTIANTAFLKDINPGADGSNAYFLIDYGALENAISNNNFINYTSSEFHTAFNGKIYFTADDGTHGNELWSTDGTAANTNLVKDINTESNNDGVGSDEIAYYTTTGIYFSATDGTHGYEPWVTDGTDAGTKMIADINTGSDDSDPSYLFIYNKQLYLNASNGGSYTDLYKINTQLSALPVSLLNFAASLQQQSVLLNWVTTNEINATQFTIERSIDGIHFTEAGTVAATGNSTSTHNYQFTDMQALQAGSSVLYYRLKTTDKDGKYGYSGVLTVQLQNGVFTFKLSPNPVHNQLTVNFTTGTAGHTTLRIADANGKMVYQQTFGTSGAASIQQNINAASFANGTYFIQLITSKEIKTLKFIKE